MNSNAFFPPEIPPQNVPEDMTINGTPDQELNSAANRRKLMMFSVVLPKGVTVEYAYHGKDIILVYRVRYMHNGQRKTVGMFSNMKDAVAAIARARYHDVLKELPHNWRDMELQAIEALSIAATEKTIKGAAELMFKSPATEAALYEDSFALLSEIPFHELSPGKAAIHTNEETGEQTTIPAKIVQAYFDKLASG